MRFNLTWSDPFKQRTVDDDEKETVSWQIWWQNVARPKPTKVTFSTVVILHYTLYNFVYVRWVTERMNEWSGGVESTELSEIDGWLFWWELFYCLSVVSGSQFITILSHNWRFYSQLLFFMLWGTFSHCLFFSDLIMLFPFYYDYD